jgi:O-methyltransferase involved in polyketide biosynthesis
LSDQGSLHDEVANEPQLWIAEGLLMYFPQDRIDSLFEELHRQSSIGNRFAFTHLESTNGRPEFRRGSRLVARWLDRHQESFAWGIQRTQLPEFLASKKMRLLPIEPLVIQELTDLNVGEYLVLAESI